MNSIEEWLRDGDLRDPLTQELLATYRRMVSMYGEGGFEIKVEAGTLYMQPPESEPE